jgi:hypothetical protein
MKVERYNIQACCGRMAIILRTDCPLTKEHLSSMVKLGFTESPHFTQAGILYVDNPDFTLTGPLGSDRLTVKCKHKEAECTQKLNDLEVLLQQVG